MCIRDSCSATQSDRVVPVDDIFRDCWRRRRHGVDLQCAGRVGYGACKNGGVARCVSHRGRTQIDRRHREVGRVLPGRHRIAEGQGLSAGPARVGRRATVVER